MSFLREILDEYVIGWDEKRYDKWKRKTTAGGMPGP